MGENFTIGEAARTLGISRESLRNWERDGFIPKPHRRLTNWRIYTSGDIKEIKNKLKRRQQNA